MSMAAAVLPVLSHRLCQYAYGFHKRTCCNVKLMAVGDTVTELPIIAAIFTCTVQSTAWPPHHISLSYLRRAEMLDMFLACDMVLHAGLATSEQLDSMCAHLLGSVAAQEWSSSKLNRPPNRSTELPARNSCERFCSSN